jgi:hypothetical protein
MKMTLAAAAAAAVVAAAAATTAMRAAWEGIRNRGGVVVLLTGTTVVAVVMAISTVVATPAVVLAALAAAVVVVAVSEGAGRSRHCRRTSCKPRSRAAQEQEPVVLPTLVVVPTACSVSSSAPGATGERGPRQCNGREVWAQ